MMIMMMNDDLMMMMYTVHECSSNLNVFSYSLMFDQDAGRKSFVEELYEQEDRNFPGGSWKAAKVPYTDVVSHTQSSFVTHSLFVICKMLSRENMSLYNNA